MARSLVAVGLVLASACASSPPAAVTPPAPEEKRSEPEASSSPSVEPPPAPPPPPKPGAFANVDPDDDYVVGPPDAFADCDDELTKAGVKFAKATLPVHHEGKKVKIVCGAPQVVTYVGGPEKIAYDPPPLLTCRMALALAWWEKIVAAEAQRILNTKITRIEQLGTYSCREVAAYPGTVSEHSYANAIDIGQFTLADGRTVSVLRDFDRAADEPKKPGGAFLRAVSRRANDEDVFSHVLTPFFNATHRNHFHLDLARFRADGTRPE